MDLALASKIAVRLAVRFECIRLRPYLCPAGVPTIGVGATYYRNGVHVTLKDAPISLEEAMDLLEWMVNTIYLPAAYKLCPAADTPERLAAIEDFAFNLGVKRLETSTLRRRVNANDWRGASKELLRWNKAGGIVLSGLTSRRKAEVVLFAPD